MGSRQIIYPPDPWAPRPDQMPLWSAIQARVDNILVITHRQFGKDELFLRGIGRDAMQTPGNYFYCLPKTVDVRKNMWEAVNVHTGMNRIDEAFPESIRKQKREDLMIIRMPTVEEGKHSNIFFTGSDNHTGLRGQTGVQYNFSEWAFSDPHSLGVVRPILAANGGRSRFFTTAFGQNHAYKMLIDNANKPNWKCFLISNNVRHPLADDPAARGIIHIQSHRLSEEKMKEILEENIQLYGPDIGKSLTAQEYECSFEEIVPGSFYLDLLLRAEREGRIMDLAPRPELPVYAAFDLGFTDPTAIWYLQVLEDGWVNVIDYDEYTLTSTPELIPELRRKTWYYGDILLPHDGAHHHGTSGTSPYKILTAAGFSVKVMPLTDDEAQIPSVRTLLPRCRFSRSSAVQRGLDCLRHFHNKAKTEGGRTSWSPKPVHDWSSHGAKAFATAAYYAPTFPHGLKPAPAPPKPSSTGAHRYVESGWMA